jgi:hypothetical protein
MGMAGTKKLSEEQRLRLLELRGMCETILDRFGERLPAADFKQLRTFYSVGEWPLLADNLAAALMQDQIPVSSADKEALRRLLYWWQTPPSGYRYIASRDEVLASLPVVDAEGLPNEG